MSERELFRQSIPQIAEMIMICRRMAPERYQQFKRDWLAEVGRRAEKALPFIRKVFIVIDTYLQEDAGAA